MTGLLCLALVRRLRISAAVHGEALGIAVEEVLDPLLRGTAAVLADEELRLEHLAGAATSWRPRVSKDDLVHLHDAGARDLSVVRDLELDEASLGEVGGLDSKKIFRQVQPRAHHVLVGGASRRTLSARTPVLAWPASAAMGVLRPLSMSTPASSTGPSISAPAAST
jgi:hypothetical protein